MFCKSQPNDYRYLDVVPAMLDTLSWDVVVHTPRKAQWISRHQTDRRDVSYLLTVTYDGVTDTTDAVLDEAENYPTPGSWKRIETDATTLGRLCLTLAPPDSTH